MNDAMNLMRDYKEIISYAILKRYVSKNTLPREVNK